LILEIAPATESVHYLSMSKTTIFSKSGKEIFMGAGRAPRDGWNGPRVAAHTAVVGLVKIEWAHALSGGEWVSQETHDLVSVSDEQSDGKQWSPTRVAAVKKGWDKEVPAPAPTLPPTPAPAPAPADPFSAEAHEAAKPALEAAVEQAKSWIARVANRSADAKRGAEAALEQAERELNFHWVWQQAQWDKRRHKQERESWERETRFADARRSN